MNTQLVIVDPQHDFCDPGGSLFVKGADKDMDQLARFVERAAPVLDDIHVSLDSHQDLHIAHPEFVVDGRGRHPDPFTIIDSAAARSGKYRAANPAVQDYWLGYIEQLEVNARYPYCIWPPHCLIGTPGQTVAPAARASLATWMHRRFATVDWVPKGSSWKTENYSIVKADVPDPDDPTTGLNMRFLKPLQEADMLIFAGEAESHCVANTAVDVADEFGDAYDFSKWVWLEDCMSSVPGFEHLATAAKDDLSGRGVRIMTSTALLKELRS